MLAELTSRVATGGLSSEDVTGAMAVLLEPKTSDESKAAFLRAWAMRGETAAELAACAKALLPRAVKPPVRGSWNGQPLLDCCGTGGGGLNLINISTGMVFILAAMGVPVVKHGNRGLTKKSGSADVLEALGIRIDLPPDKMEACLEKVGAAFLFAPAYHTSFSAIAAVRKQLGAEGQRTVFNLLGPLLNPARPDARLVGVFSEKDVELYQAALKDMGCPRFTVACGQDAASGTRIGEVSASGPTWLRSTMLESEGTTKNRFGEGSGEIKQLEVLGSIHSAQKLSDILAGEERGIARDTLLVNAAIAAWTQGRADTLAEGLIMASEALDSRRALGVLRKWQAFSQAA